MFNILGIMSRVLRNWTCLLFLYFDETCHWKLQLFQHILFCYNFSSIICFWQWVYFHSRIWNNLAGRKSMVEGLLRFSVYKVIFCQTLDQHTKYTLDQHRNLLRSSVYKVICWHTYVILIEHKVCQQRKESGQVMEPSWVKD